eukprot:3942620-Prorocentrum_lima.AAC.1
MTSSLVGSEMCIRDRFSRLRSGPPHVLAFPSGRPASSLMYPHRHFTDTHHHWLLAWLLEAILLVSLLSCRDASD